MSWTPTKELVEKCRDAFWDELMGETNARPAYEPMAAALKEAVGCGALMPKHYLRFSDFFIHDDMLATGESHFYHPPEVCNALYFIYPEEWDE